MRVHHLNCGTFCPFGGRLMHGVSRGAIGHLVCHCLLVETDRDGLALVDTGLGLRDMRELFPRLSRLYANLLNIRFDLEQSAVRQVERLFAARDVRHVVLTHLDFDHAGGIEDFPEATVHLLEAEAEAALRRRRGFVAERRYRPQQWGDTSRWQRYRAARGTLVRVRGRARPGWAAAGDPAGPAGRPHVRPFRRGDPQRRRLAAQRRRRLLLPRRGRLQGAPLPTGAARLPAADGGGPGRPAGRNRRLREPSWRSPSCG